MKKIFTIEYDSTNEMVELHLNDEGIDNLVQVLQGLKANNSQDHQHLMTEGWGGSELTDKKQNLDDNVKLINHLKVLYWK